MRTAVLVFTVPLLAKEGLGEVDYDPALPKRGNEDKGGGVKAAVLVFTVPLLAKEGLGEVDYDPGLQRRGNES